LKFLSYAFDHSLFLLLGENIGLIGFREKVSLALESGEEGQGTKKKKGSQRGRSDWRDFVVLSVETGKSSYVSYKKVDWQGKKTAKSDKYK